MFHTHVPFSAKLTAGVDEKEKMRFAFDIYDVDKDGHISNGELFGVMKMMVGNNLNDQQVCEIFVSVSVFVWWLWRPYLFLICLISAWQLQQLVDRTILQADRDGDGMISFSEFEAVGESVGFRYQLFSFQMVSHIDIADKLRIDV